MGGTLGVRKENYRIYRTDDSVSTIVLPIDYAFFLPFFNFVYNCSHGSCSRNSIEKKLAYILFDIINCLCD